MLPELSPAVARALEVARLRAYLLQTAAVEPVHVLQGLVEEEEGLAAVLLREAGLDPAGLIRLAARPPAPVPSPDLGFLPYSSQLEKIFFQAHHLAGELSGDFTLGSKPLLLALLRGDSSLLLELEGLGLSLTRLEANLFPQKGQTLEPEEPLRLAQEQEEIDTARILDAGANRAREALRVIEDYCRFALDDAFLSRELKYLRHELAETLAGLTPAVLLESRETLRDVGTTLSTAQERTRYSLLAVVQANLKRLQEALRSLEEFGKLHHPDLGQALERLRYRSYTLERAIVLGTSARERLAEARLYVLVSGALCSAALDWTIEEAAAGGAQVFQLREKKLNDRALLERARNVRRWTRKAGVLFIMNDRPDLARLAEADGVHLGQDDLPLKEARRILGPAAFIGVSTHSLEQVRQAILDGASYIGVGPAFPSGTKEFTDFPGLDFVRQAVAETSLPTFVLGGVNPETVGGVLTAGGKRIAVSQAICQADDPRQAAALLRQALEAVPG